MTDDVTLPDNFTEQEKELRTLRGICQRIAQSGLFGVKDTNQAFVIALKGRDLKIDPTLALTHIHVINGKATCSAELQLALIFKNCPGAKVHYKETTNDKCVIQASRPGMEPSDFQFTIEDAKRADLTTKKSWKHWPRAMLRARCISEMARALFPDAIGGLSYTPEEMGQEVTEEGLLVSE